MFSFIFRIHFFHKIKKKKIAVSQERHWCPIMHFGLFTLSFAGFRFVLASRDNMAAALRGTDWMEDCDLKNALENLVKKGYTRNEILIIIKKDFPRYVWGCVKTLDRRLRHFPINYIYYDTALEAVHDVIKQELQGPGSLLGVRVVVFL